jgi:hypothetical protein
VETVCCAGMLAINTTIRKALVARFGIMATPGRGMAKISTQLRAIYHQNCLFLQISL